MERRLKALVAFSCFLQVMIVLNQIRRIYAEVPTAQNPVQDAAPHTTINVRSMKKKGNIQAKIAIIEFSDFECPFCSRHTNAVAPALDNEFVVPGNVQRIFANFPLAIHNDAIFLANSALCAGDQGRFWDMHDRLFWKALRHKDDVRKEATELGIDPVRFDKCLEEHLDLKEIEADQLQARRLGFTGTPSFAIGIYTGEDIVTVKKTIVGAQSVDVFESALNQLLRAVR
jgi:protein-disulfide isomerase